METRRHGNVMVVTLKSATIGHRSATCVEDDTVIIAPIELTAGPVGKPKLRARPCRRARADNLIYQVATLSYHSHERCEGLRLSVHQNLQLGLS